LEDVGVDGRVLLKTDLKEIEWEGVDWIDTAHDREKGRTAAGSMKCREFLD
jgi:hypothetical protein